MVGGCQVAMSGESLIDACSLFVVRTSAVGSSIPTSYSTTANRIHAINN